jgi:hypothetical protein
MCVEQDRVSYAYVDEALIYLKEVYCRPNCSTDMKAPFLVLIKGVSLLGCGCELDEAYRVHTPEMGNASKVLSRRGWR